MGSDNVGLAYCPTFGIDVFNMAIIIICIPIILCSIYFVYVIASTLSSAYQSITMHKMVKYGNIAISIVFVGASIFCLISVMNCAFADAEESEHSIVAIDRQSTRALLFGLFFLGLGIYFLNLTFLYQFWKVFFGSQYACPALLLNALYLFVLFSILVAGLAVVLWFVDEVACEVLFAASVVFAIAQMVTILGLFLRSLTKIALHQMSIDVEYNENLTNNNKAYSSYLRRSENELSLAEREKTLLKVGTRCLVLYFVVFSSNMGYFFFTVARYANVDRARQNNEFLYYLNAFLLVLSDFACIVCVYLQFDFASLYFERYCDKCFACCTFVEMYISSVMLGKRNKEMTRRMNRKDSEMDQEHAPLIGVAVGPPGAGTGPAKDGGYAGIQIGAAPNKKDSSLGGGGGAGRGRGGAGAGDKEAPRSSLKNVSKAVAKNVSALIKKGSDHNSDNDSGNGNSNDGSSNDKNRRKKTDSDSSGSNSNHHQNAGDAAMGGAARGNPALAVNTSGTFNITHDIETPILNREFSIDQGLQDAAPRGRSQAMSNKSKQNLLDGTEDDDDALPR